MVDPIVRMKSICLVQIVLTIKTFLFTGFRLVQSRHLKGDSTGCVKTKSTNELSLFIGASFDIIQ